MKSSAVIGAWRRPLTCAAFTIAALGILGLSTAMPARAEFIERELQSGQRRGNAGRPPPVHVRIARDFALSINRKHIGPRGGRRF